MKLYVWTDFERDWAGGLAFAIAQDEAGARNSIRFKFQSNQKLDRDPDFGHQMKVYELDSPVAHWCRGSS